MKTACLTQKAVYETPEVDLLVLSIEKSILSVPAGGQNVTFQDEEDFDTFFN